MPSGSYSVKSSMSYPSSELTIAEAGEPEFGPRRINEPDCWREGVSVIDPETRRRRDHAEPAGIGVKSTTVRRGSRGRRVDDALRLDLEARRVYAGEEELSLTGKEFDVLSVLEEHRDRVVPRERLMSEVWDANHFGSTKTLDVTIGRLRQKLEQAGLPDRVVAIRGVGFRLEHTRPAD